MPLSLVSKVLSEIFKTIFRLSFVLNGFNARSYYHTFTEQQKLRFGLFKSNSGNFVVSNSLLVHN